MKKSRERLTVDLIKANKRLEQEKHKLRGHGGDYDLKEQFAQLRRITTIYFRIVA